MEKKKKDTFFLAAKLIKTPLIVQRKSLKSRHPTNTYFNSSHFFTYVQSLHDSRRKQISKLNTEVF